MKEKAIKLLRLTEREGIENLIKHLDEIGFFVSPASTKYHNSFEGGLIKHSVSVMNIFGDMLGKTRASMDPSSKITRSSAILCSLLHDVCKAGAYIKTPYGYKYNLNHPAGHARRSLEIIEKFITLTQLETIMILFHMGPYGTTEFSDKGEYSLLELVNAYNVHKVAKLFYFCDDMSAQFYEMKGNV